MTLGAIQNAVALGTKLKHVFVATADANGLPHVAAAGRMTLVSQTSVAVEAWFCPGTVMNLAQNVRVALVVWDALAGNGFQILGEVEKMEEKALLNGYAQETEHLGPSPQV
ncbi:MAG: pyridoxamine 5'-phosphate oxidase family protein, partial [Desulfobacteraceae bacterium]